jgi:alkylation response protein AidB-like acyl-CoA dehydrogenase
MVSHQSIYDNPDHELLRDQVARFIAKEVEPHAHAWEEQGYVPRDVLHRMGQAVGRALKKTGWLSSDTAVVEPAVMLEEVAKRY